MYVIKNGLQRQKQVVSLQTLLLLATKRFLLRKGGTMKLYDEKDRVYIGKEEAFELMLERNIEKLPRKGTEIVTCRQVGLGDSILGKDENGFYNVELN